MSSTEPIANDTSREQPRNLVAICPFFIVADLRASVAFYRERLGFELEFEGPEGDAYYAGVNRDGIGAWVECRIGETVQRRQVMPTRSYLSQVELPVTFGLGEATIQDERTA